MESNVAKGINYENFISRIEKMLIDERAHLAYLKLHYAPDYMHVNSESAISHLQIRLEQYRDFCGTSNQPKGTNE